MSGVKWDGDKAKTQALAEARRRISAAAIAVANRAKVLLSIAGTGVVLDDGSTNRRRLRKKRLGELRAFVKEHNAAHSRAFKMGAAKRLRVTKAGGLTTRRKSRKKKP